VQIWHGTEWRSLQPDPGVGVPALAGERPQIGWSRDSWTWAARWRHPYCWLLYPGYFLQLLQAVPSRHNRLKVPRREHKVGNNRSNCISRFFPLPQQGVSGNHNVAGWSITIPPYNWAECQAVAPRTLRFPHNVDLLSSLRTGPS